MARKMSDGVENSLFSVGRSTNMHFPSSEADGNDSWWASRMGKARCLGLLGSEADGKGSWWASRNSEPRYLAEDSGACRYCTLEIVSWWDSMLKIVSWDSMPGRMNTDTGVC